jgi:molybdate transport system regulatory protein
MNHPHESSWTELTLRLHIDTPLGTFLGSGRIALLEAVDRRGSIAQAAKEVGLSYKAAWDAVDDMNNLSVEALVVRTPGGARGGGTRLTPHGRRLIAFYRALEAEYQAATLRLQRVLDDVEDQNGPHAAMADYRRLLHRMAVQTSARNQVVGRIESVLREDVEARVRLDLGEGVRLEVCVTAESLERLKLRPGMEVHAWFKSSAVTLWSETAAPLDQPNRYLGQIERCAVGAHKADVTVRLQGSRLQLAAMMPAASVQELDFHPGVVVTAVIKASSVLLALAG